MTHEFIFLKDWMDKEYFCNLLCLIYILDPFIIVYTELSILNLRFYSRNNVVVHTECLDQNTTKI